MQEPDARIHAALARADLEAAGLDAPEAALLQFVRKLTEHAHRIVDDDTDTLRALGWTDPQIAECVYVAALFGFYNRVADAFGLDDPDYFGNPPARGGDPIPTEAPP